MVHGAGLVHFIIASVDRHRREASVLASGLELLGYLCSDDEIRFSAAVAGSVKAIIEAVEAHREHPGVCLFGVNAITHFTKPGKAWVLLNRAAGGSTYPINQGAHLLCMEILRSEPGGDVGVAEACLKCLAALTEHAPRPEVREHVLEDGPGIVSTLRGVLARHPLSIPVHAHALRIIAHLAHGSDALCTRLVDLGADQLALDAFAKYPADAQVALHGKGALWNLSPFSEQCLSKLKGGSPRRRAAR